MDDHFIVQQVCAGNQGAFKFLVIRYQRPIFKFLTAFHFNQPMIEEIAQETFLRAYKNIHSYDPKKGAAFSTWLFLIAKNLALNELSRLPRKMELFPDEKDSEKIKNVADNGLLQDKIIQEGERKSAVLKAIGQLPEEYRSAVVLSYFQELSLEEVAKIEECSIGTIKSRVFRGKQILRSLLLKEKEAEV